MGTYTANYQLYMPTVGETGWGTLINGNYQTIDTTMKSLSNRIGTLETETDALAADIAALEGVSNGGAIKSSSITNSGTITSTGLITGNGGFKGNLTGNVTGFLFVKGTVGTSGDDVYATCDVQSVTRVSSHTVTVNNYSITYGNPQKLAHGVYTRRSDLSGTVSPSVSTRTCVIKNSGSTTVMDVEYKISTDSTYTTVTLNGNASTTVTLQVGKTYQFYGYKTGTTTAHNYMTLTINSEPSYYVKYNAP